MPFSDGVITSRMICIGGVNNRALASNVITSDKIAAGAIDDPVYFDGSVIQPVQYVSSLPADNTNGDFAFLTTNGKLYRWYSGAWTVAVEGGDIVNASIVASDKIQSNSITTGLIQSGAITTDLLAANAVTVGKVNEFLKSFRTWSEDFADFDEDSVWTSKTGTGTATVVNSANAKYGGNVLQVDDYAAWYAYGGQIPFDDSVMYRVKVRYRKTVDGTNSELIYFGFSCRDYLGAGTTGNNGNVYFVSGANPSVGVWQEGTYYVLGRTAGDPAANSATVADPMQMDVDTAWIAPLMLVNYNTNDGGQWEIDYFTVEAFAQSQEVGATLITDGAITTAKIDALAVNASKIAAGAVETAKLDALAVTTAKLDADAVTAAKLSSIELEVGKHIRSTTYTAGTDGWSINANGTAEFDSVTVRGTIEATTIEGDMILSTGGKFATSSGTTSNDQRIEIVDTAIDELRFWSGKGESSPAKIIAYDGDVVAVMRIDGPGTDPSRITVINPHLYLDAGNDASISIGTGSPAEVVIGADTGTLEASAMTIQQGNVILHRTYNNTDEGGQLQFEGGTSYSTAWYLDRHQNNMRMIYGASEKIRIASDGDITTVGAIRAGAVGGTLNNGYLYANPPSEAGSVDAQWVLATGSTYYLVRDSSSRRYKRDIEPWNGSVRGLRAKSFIHSTPDPDGVRRWNPYRSFGLIAEDAAEVVPEATVYSNGDVESWSKGAMIAALVNDVNRLYALIDELDDRS